MKKTCWRLALCAWLCAGVPGRADPAPEILTVDEAARRIGETVTFEGKVEGVAASPQFQATYVSFGGAYPRQKLSVLFAGEYEKILTSCQMPRLNDRTVRVTGLVEKGKKCPVVRVTDAKQDDMLARIFVGTRPTISQEASLFITMLLDAPRKPRPARGAAFLFPPRL